MMASALTIGAFDGVHLGHRAVLDRLQAEATRLGLEPMVVTFEPLPREFLHGDDAPPRIQTVDDRMSALNDAGVARVACLAFDEALARMDASEFVADLLVGSFGARAIVVGDDFRFGHERAGDVAMLHELGLELGFSVIPTPTHAQDGERVSSTRIRAALTAGDLDAAAALLGRPYAVSGTVEHGDALGRKLGFPTANLVPGVRLALADGSYAAQVRIGDAWHRAAAYSHGGRLEAHLLDFDGELYGQRIEVRLERFVRAHAKIDNFERLRAVIAADVEAIRNRDAKSVAPTLDN